ncbi:MAG: TIGR01458 family HAD-type hydrolase [Pseudomonadota bacterium]|nr:TIGR01458 family HAD-type hydrolase [Pseudomonadota bacterium]
MTAILFDLDGVLYQGDEPVPGAAEALDWVRARAIPHLYLTNTSSRPRSAIAEKLAHMGMEVHEEEILTPPVAARTWLRQRNVKDLVLLVPEATRAEFSGLPELPADRETGAGAVIVGDLGKGWDFPTLNRAFRLLMEQPPPYLIALGMTRYWRAPEGLRLDAAPFVVALQHATGVEPLVLGKPAQPFFEAALTAVGAPAQDTLMIGDDIRGDVGGAQRAGIRGLLVRTGKFRPQDLAGDIKPDAVLESVADLPVWWRASALSP